MLISEISNGGNSWSLNWAVWVIPGYSLLSSKVYYVRAVFLAGLSDSLCMLGEHLHFPSFTGLLYMYQLGSVLIKHLTNKKDHW